MKKYETYKHSGIDWLGEIPSHWEVKPGFTVLKERKEKNKGMISNNVLSLSYGKIIEKPLEKLTGLVPENFETYQLIHQGDIIFRPTDLQNDKVSLRTGLSNYDGIITSAYINLQPINKSVPKFVHYFLHTTDTNKVIYGLGSGLRQNISFLDFKRFLFAVPPIHEQEAIAAFLDEKCRKIDALVEIKSQQIEKLKELRQVKIHQAVTKGISDTEGSRSAEMKDSGIDWIGEIPKHWEVKKVKEICNLYGRIGFRGYNQSDLVAEGDGCITISPSNIVENTMHFEKNSYLSWEKYYESPEIMIFNNDILIVKTGSTVGKVGIVKNLNEKATINPQLIVLKNIKMNVDFYYQYLHSELFYDLIRSNAIGSTIPTISETKIGNLQIIVPPLSEQEAIVAYLEEVTGKIDQAIAQKQEQIEKLKQYKQSLINEVVTGKVKVC